MGEKAAGVVHQDVNAGVDGGKGVQDGGGALRGVPAAGVGMGAGIGLGAGNGGYGLADGSGGGGGAGHGEHAGAGFGQGGGQVRRFAAAGGGDDGSPAGKVVFGRQSHCGYGSRRLWLQTAAVPVGVGGVGYGWPYGSSGATGA